MNEDFFTPKVLLALFSVGLTLFGYWFYFRDIFAGKTKPHAYSWLVWGVLTGIGFAGQVAGGGGAGAWATLTTAIFSGVIFFLALQRGEKNITRSDKIFLAAAGLALLIWPLTNDPLLSVILITIIDFLGFLPTIRKSWSKPHQETLISSMLAGLKFVLAIFALENYSLITWLYPASLVLANAFFVTMLIIRRKQLGLRPGMTSTEVF